VAYRFEYSRRADRELGRLTKSYRQRVMRRVRELAQEPRRSGSKQLQGRPIRWASRVGDLRIVYAIIDREQRIYIESVGNRDNIYELMRRR